MSLALNARRAVLMPGLWVRNELWRRAKAVPSLDLRFAESKSLVDATTGQSLVTFTRASSGTFVGSDGLIKTATTNEPRFDHNPTTGESLGLLVEEQRTNSVTNNTMVGAVAGTPGTNPTGWVYATAQSNGLTISIAGAGVENGINYIDYRFNGTTVASPNACAIGIVNATAATAQTWTASTYWKLAAGTTAGTNAWQLGLIENTAGGTFVTGAFYSQTAPTSAALITQRPTATRTLSGGGTVGMVTLPINIPVAGNTAIDFTLRIGLPQLEQGAFATSVIPTSTAAVTRSADVASITGTNFSSWYRQDEGTVFADVSVLSTAGFNQTISLNDGTSNNRVELRPVGSLATNIRSDCVIAGVAKYSNTAITVTDQQRRVCTLAVKVNDFRLQSGSSGISPTSDAVPVVDRLYLNYATFAGGEVNGTIKRLCFWPQRLSNNTLQTLTQ